VALLSGQKLQQAIIAERSLTSPIPAADQATLLFLTKQTTRIYLIMSFIAVGFLWKCKPLLNWQLVCARLR
jgi:hypothetical protein